MHIDWFENNEKFHVLWLKNPAHSCFRIFDNQDYFFVEIKNGMFKISENLALLNTLLVAATADDLIKIGMERVGNSLIEKIAHLTNTSVLRFGDFMVLFILLIFQNNIRNSVDHDA